MREKCLGRKRTNLDQGAGGVEVKSENPEKTRVGTGWGDAGKPLGGEGQNLKLAFQKSSTKKS